MSKSYVGMQNFICPICGKQHAHGASILMNTRLKEVFDSAPVVTGYKPCEEHQAMMDSGEVVFLIEVNEVGDPTGNDSILLSVSCLEHLFEPEIVTQLKKHKMALTPAGVFNSIKDALQKATKETVTIN